MSELVACPLCGCRFEPIPHCPAGCPLAHRCNSLCCPNCGYRFVTTSRLARWLERLLRRGGKDE
ncbi:MAG: hypothetical protein HXY19_00775 [Thermoanaerobaculaceae bacterium]|nr:hypothetical protein [Thermoanaerobaculaceae bacterium]